MPKLKGKPKPKAGLAMNILEKFLQTYEKHCTASQSCVSPTIKHDLQQCITNDMFITKFVLTNVESLSRNVHPVYLTPLLRTIRDERYRRGKELCICGINLYPQDIANLAILLELDGRTIYPFSKLEITHHVLDLWSMERLGMALPYSRLSSLVLDYSKCGDNCVNRLTDGLDGNRKLLTLSLCYCDLGPESGITLATLVVQTAICNLFLDGNHLQCLGAIELLRPVAEYEESIGQVKKANAQLSLEAANKDADLHSKVVNLNTTSKTNSRTTMENSRKKKKRRVSKKKIKKPDPGPWLARLHLADNAIDGRFRQTEENIREFVRLLSSLIRNSDHLVEVDIDGNAIGEESAVSILEALKDRKKDKMPHINIEVTPQMSSMTFREIFKNCFKTAKKRKKKKIK
ncbi:uncharacterized protein LOC118093484 isoform X1 [Zootoca vivipara]|uniref:uncharacterized protein LOC118093484 isoform X1 n=1 Tax=Zootoca vivipara TaxID=8524 RepID=UPI00293B987D|nr:uncharacterized protein LOC118093484 isoform X1 [Zootoca vivipara]